MKPFVVKLYSAATIKKRLMEYRDKERYIDAQIERLENLQSKMYAIGTPVMSDMPKAPSAIQDRIGVMVAQKEEIECELHDLIDYQKQEKVWIDEVLEMLGMEEKTVMQIRYIDCESWNKVTKIMFGSKDDFQDKAESYLRQCTRLHKRAIQEIVTYMNSK